MELTAGGSLLSVWRGGAHYREQVDVSFQVVSFDSASSEMTARVSFRLDEDLAKDPVTPSADLEALPEWNPWASRDQVPRDKKSIPSLPFSPSMAM